MNRLAPVMDLYTQFRPLILLPFNIWLFFVTLPFRIFFGITSGLFVKKAKEQVKEKTIEFKKEVAKIEQADKIEKQSDKSIEEEAEESESESEDESEELRQQLSQFEERERTTADERKRLEEQLEDLSKRVHEDEEALATVETEKQRYRKLIGVEQKKCFDFQQQIIALKNQLKTEKQSKLAAEGELQSIKKDKATEKRKAKRQASKSKNTDQSAPAQSTPAQADQNQNAGETHSAWHTTEHKGFTEMVAEAQREELQHGKKFSEVLKTAIEEDKPVVAEEKPEFIVIGGDMSNKHVI